MGTFGPGFDAKDMEFSSQMLHIKDAPHRDEHFDIKNVEF